MARSTSSRSNWSASISTMREASKPRKRVARCELVGTPEKSSQEQYLLPTVSSHRSISAFDALGLARMKALYISTAFRLGIRNCRPPSIFLNRLWPVSTKAVPELPSTSSKVSKVVSWLACAVLRRM